MYIWIALFLSLSLLWTVRSTGKVFKGLCPSCLVVCLLLSIIVIHVSLGLPRSCFCVASDFLGNAVYLSRAISVRRVLSLPCLSVEPFAFVLLRAAPRFLILLNIGPVEG